MGRLYNIWVLNAKKKNTKILILLHWNNFFFFFENSFYQVSTGTKFKNEKFSREKKKKKKFGSLERIICRAILDKCNIDCSSDANSAYGLFKIRFRSPVSDLWLTRWYLPRLLICRLDFTRFDIRAFIHLSKPSVACF